MYHNYAEIVELILEAFKITVVQQVVYLSVVSIKLFKIAGAKFINL